MVSRIVLPVALSGADHLPRLAPRRRVEARGRLVEEQQLGVADQRHRDVQAPLLTAGQLLGALVGLRPEPDAGDRVVDAERVREVAGEELERLADGEQAGRLGLLEHDADPRPPRPAGARRVLAEHGDLARVALAEALEDLDGGRLAGAVGPEEGEHLALVDLEIEAAERFDVAVRLPQSPDLDDRHPGGILR